MRIVLDANLLVTLASGDPRRATVKQHIEHWLHGGDTLHAPELLPYELANSLTRLVAANAFPMNQLDQAMRTVDAVPISYHRLTDIVAVVTIAIRLRRQSAYDAAYLALTEELDAELWTLGGPLYRNARSLGFPVHLAE